MIKIWRGEFAKSLEFPSCTSHNIGRFSQHVPRRPGPTLRLTNDLCGGSSHCKDRHQHKFPFGSTSIHRCLCRYRSRCECATNQGCKTGTGLWTAVNVVSPLKIIKLQGGHGTGKTGEFGSYFFQTGKTQGIWLWHREKFWDTGKIFFYGTGKKFRHRGK